ncbi:hypothetical protein ACN4EK_23760 [Pantanalinema rosaneae CENA516]|uniref:hypothetical protein n=1 Tax=Pantanalinema rosaneae TaxID=1620701 RepID=UPI003D6E725E
MEQWDFLLQKEGDRSWLPLDSPDVEILEGRYRIVARSGYVNTEVNISISYLTVDEDTPKRRSKRRTGRTNPNGLMVILPYTHLKSGIWQITCTSTDVMADLLGADWRRSVRLQVLANIGIEEDPHPIVPPVDQVPPAVASALLHGMAAPDAEAVIAAPPSPLTSQEIEPEESLESDIEGLPELPALPTPNTATVEPIAASTTPGAGAMPSIDDLASLNLEIAQVLGLSMDRLLEITEQLSHQVVEEALRGLNLTELAESWRQSTEMTSADRLVSEAVAPEMPVTPSEPEPAIAVEPAIPAVSSEWISVATLQLRLNCESLTACCGDTLTLSGWIELNPDAEPSQPAQPFPDWLNSLTALEGDPETIPFAEAKVQELRINLRDPQTSELLCSDRQSIACLTTALPFSFSLRLPGDLTTHLLVGEVALYGSLPDASDAELVVLKSQPFSVTVDPDQLMAEWAKVNQTLANHTDAEDMLDLPVQLSVELAEAQQRSLLDLSFLKLAKPPLPEPEPEPEPVAPTLSSVSGHILPPQLYRPDPEQVGKKPLELPTFRAVASVEEDELTAEVNTLESPLEAELEPEVDPLTPVDLDTAATEPEAFTDPEIDQSQPTTIVQTAELFSVRELDVDMVPEGVDAPRSPVQVAFQALNLQERFFNRLNALASDTDLKVSLQTTVGKSESFNTQPSVAATMISTDFAASEFVVDDEPGVDDRRQRRSRGLTRQAIAEMPEQPNPLILLPDEPVPVPILEILADELIAGETVNIRVTLPNLLPRIYVKLWVNDRQTRSLLAGPQWLMDFFPNGFDALEAIIPLTVPQGSVEVRIEAIAVEIQTQRESRKVVLDQAVILDDFPLVSLDEFDA